MINDIVMHFKKFLTFILACGRNTLTFMCVTSSKMNLIQNKRKSISWLFMAFAMMFPMILSAQYFGRNKPMYHTLDFEIMSTQHFDIHHYLKNRDLLKRFAQDAELWYELHQAVLQDTFYSKNPMILYNDHSDFQMTNAIFGEVSIGTGGVTEGFKNRVILPLTFTHEQTHHVLGHEMVHAFQYHMMSSSQGTNLQSIGNIPLWMIEGLAEYLSIGKIDAHTAMWMRDAVLNKDVPSIRDLNSYKYFPYRYGQAFWSYLAGTYGDQVIRPFFMTVAQVGLDETVQGMFGKTREEMSEEFINTLTDYYSPLMGEGKENFIGRKIISGENAGTLNVSPSLSPNGRYIIFLSEKNLFSTDLYLADARNGEIKKRITRLVRDGHIDDLDFIESAGAWSPNSKLFAFVVYKQGKNVIIIKEAETGKTEDEIVIPEIHAIRNPVWGHDGKSIVFAGMVEGKVDLYRYTFPSKRDQKRKKPGRLKRLTDDFASQIQPNINKHGTHIVFSTDQLSLDNGRTHGKYKMNLAILNIETGEIEQLDLFPGADNLNPQYDHEGNIVFLSDRDGFRNVYKYNPESTEVTQMTDFLTGVSGITKYSPAISVSKIRDRIVYTHYYRGDYTIYQSTSERLLSEPVDKYDVDFTAAVIPADNPDVAQIVQENMDKLDRLSRTEDMQKEKYRPRFTLDHLGGSAGVGVGGGTFGTRTGLASGIEMFFSDMVGYHQLFATVAINGDIKDIGGQLTYLNNKHRISYGVTVSHIPDRYGSISFPYLDTLYNFQPPLPVISEDISVLRIFEQRIGGILQYPFSKIMRAETNFGVNFRSFRQDVYSNYYTEDGRYFDRSDTRRVPLEGDEILVGRYLVRKGAFYDFGVALVGDNAQFGMTSPMNGYRWRIEAVKYFGTYDYFSTNVDLRAYQFLGRFSLAGRVQHGSRFGTDANNINPIFIGWQGFARGYTYNQVRKLIDRQMNNVQPGEDYIFNLEEVTLERLIGSKYLMTGFEFRIPFTGPERLALINSGFLLTDVSFFIDAGVAFDDYDHLFNGEPLVVVRAESGIQEEYIKPLLAASAGVSLRINLFNAMILEPYVAYPFQKDATFWFGFNFLPGW